MEPYHDRMPVLLGPGDFDALDDGMPLCDSLDLSTL